MKIVIAKILTDTGSIEACRVFDIFTKSTEELSLKKIRVLINSGETIVGFKTAHVNNYMSGNVKTNLIKERGKFSFNKVPVITGSGDLVNKSDADKLTVYGWKGFAEAKKYFCLDYTGKEVTLSVEEFKQKVTEDKINGAMMNPKTGKPNILNLLDNEM